MLGNFGDAKAIGDGVFEMRVTFGPGYLLARVQEVDRTCLEVIESTKKA
jgi:putative component of toxin-antitoxin plasmid stabilization module